MEYEDSSEEEAERRKKELETQTTNSSGDNFSDLNARLEALKRTDQ